MSKVVIELTVVTSNETDATKAAEVVSRAATGLALDGMSAAITINSVPAKNRS